MWQLIGSGLAAIGGTVASLLSNDKATKAIDQGVQGVQAATRVAQATDSQIAAEADAAAQSGGTGPGTAFLRTLVADPGSLTPAQRSQLADLRASTANQLHGSDFAGNGRTAAAVFGKVEDEFTNNALASNRQQAIGAANTLSSASTAAQGQKFTALRAGADAGITGANAGLKGAEANANNDIATGKLIGQAIGDIGSAATKSTKGMTLGDIGKSGAVD